MGYGRLNDEWDPPGPSQNFGEGSFQIRDGGAVDGSQVSRPDLNSSAALFVPPPLTNAWPSMSSCVNTDGFYQYPPQDSRVGNNSMTGVTRHSYILSPQFDPSISTHGGGMRNVATRSSGLQNSEVVRANPMVFRSNTAGGYQKNNQIGETEGKVDGSFLTLGIGSNPEARSKRKFDPRQIASRLDEAACTKIDNFYSQPAANVLPNSSDDFSGFNRNLGSRAIMKFNHREFASKLEEDVGRRSINPSSQLTTSAYPNYTSGFSTFSSNPVAFVEPMSNMGTWMSPQCDELMQDAPANPYNGLLNEEPFERRSSFDNDYNPIGYLDASSRKQSVSQSCTYSQGGPPTLPQVKDAYSYQILPEFRPSESSRHPWITSQPSGEALKISHSRNTGDASASFVSNSSKATGSSVTRDYLGQLSSTDGAHSVYAYGHSTIPEKSFTQTVASNADKTPAGASFPRRLGVQFSDVSVDATAATQSSNQTFVSMNAGVQTRGNLQQYQFPRPPQAAQYLGSIPGNHQTRLPVQSNIQTPFTATGQVQSANRGVDGPSQVYSSAQQSLKRRAAESQTVPSLGQKRRFHTVPHYPKADMPTASSTVPQIKWTGFDGPPVSEPQGHRCLICKLDLVYEPERMPPVASNPPVAILPCGHTFHDHCLQLITPDNERHDPPCIPCALGET